MRSTLLTVIGVFFLSAVLWADESVEDLLKAAKELAGKGRLDEAKAVVEKAIAQEPKNARPYFFRSSIHSLAGKSAEAVADLDKAIVLDPKLAEAYHFRGCEHFRLGHIKESLADFDKFLAMKPNAAPGHWQRGITCYYAGKFAEGRDQFGIYEKVDANDVENAVWHFICAAKVDGVEKARAGLLKIDFDRRVPMMVVYDLFAGKVKPQAVMDAAQAGEVPADERKMRLFYANLYLGLYYEAVGEPKKALEHLTKAAEEHKIGHYMGDVARVHVELLRRKKPDQ